MADIQYILLVCNSHRPKVPGGGCCNDKGSEDLLSAFQAEINAKNLNDRVILRQAACLHHCLTGISVKVLPGEVYYARVKIADIAEILDTHIAGGQPVPRLFPPAISETDRGPISRRLGF